MRLKKYWFLVLFLGGCSTVQEHMPATALWHDKTNDYLNAEAYPALYVPEPLEVAAQDKTFAIPKVDYPAVDSVDIRPPDLRS